MDQRSPARVVVGPHNVISVHVPPAMMYDREALQAFTSGLLGRFGCLTCHSGLQIAYQLAEGESTDK